MSDEELAAVDKALEKHLRELALDEPIARYFTFTHLPDGPMRETSRNLAIIARRTVTEVRPSAERSAGLRKLLEAKDCLVRAVLP